MKIYTKKGDQGETSLFGGVRVLKCDERVDAYGNIDELIANLGVIRSVDIKAEYKTRIEYIQNTLMNISSLVSDSKGKLSEKIVFTMDEVSKLESDIDAMNKLIPPLTNFVIPGGDLESSYCHVARTVCRRAERRLVELNKNVQLQEVILPYFNRLSDYLFTLARVIYSENTGKRENEFLVKKS